MQTRMLPIAAALAAAVAFNSLLPPGLLASDAVFPEQEQTPAAVTDFLSKRIGLSAKEIEPLEKGAPVVKVFETKEREDVAIFGVIALDISREAYLARAKDFKRSLHTPTRVAFGLFSDPAKPADVSAAVVDSQDFADLPECKPGSCKVKLPEAGMQNLLKTVDWKAPDALDKVNAFARERMAAYVTGYRAKGDTAMVVYADRGPTRASDAFASLLAQDSLVFEFVPAFHKYLKDFPSGKLEGASDVMYWSVEEIPELRPIFNVNHLSIYSPPEMPGTTLLATKQIFSNHYLEALFDLATVIERPTQSGKPRTYLMVIRRVRFDQMPKVGMVSLKGKVTGQFKDQLTGYLESQKKQSD